MCASTAVNMVTTSNTINLLTIFHDTNMGLHKNEMFALWRTQEILEGSKKLDFTLSEHAMC